MEKKITIKDLPNYGYGGTDICGEWQSNGSYYTQLSRGCFGLKHNYQADFRRHFKGGWHVTVWICLSACNSTEIKIAENKFKTLKECRLFAIDEIHSTEEKDLLEPLKSFLSIKARPVFTISNEDVKLEGTTYVGLCSDYSSYNNSHWREIHLYYNDDLPKYNAYKEYYDLGTNWRGDTVSIGHLKPFSCGYSDGSLSPEQVDKYFPVMMNLIKEVEMYYPIYSKLSETKQALLS